MNQGVRTRRWIASALAAAAGVGARPARGVVPRRGLFIVWTLAIALVVVSVARYATAAHAQSATPVALALPANLPGVGAPTRVAMRNVDFHVAEGVVLHIHRLDGEMHGTKDGVVNFDDASSYVTDIRSAEVALRGSDLTALMNDHVFAYRGAPLKHLHVTLHDGLVRQTGTLHKGVDIPFEIDAEPSLVADGRIRLHPKRIRIFGVNGEALMRALGLTLQKMVDLSKAKGIAVEKNDLILDAVAVLPPPAIRGRLTAVRVVGDELVQVFGSPGDSAAAASPPLALPDSSVANFMFYRGGTLHFGKLFMADAEMLVVDGDARDPFDFDNPHYQRQLIAGQSRTLPDLGLEVRMPDAHTLPPLSSKAAGGR